MAEVPEHPQILTGFISVLELLSFREAMPRNPVCDFLSVVLSYLLHSLHLAEFLRVHKKSYE